VAAASAYASARPSDDLLLVQAKNNILEQQDIYAADDQLAKIMQNPSSKVYQQACFWRAATVLSSNPLLKAKAKEFGILGEKGDGDATEDIIANDEKGYSKISLTTVDPIIIDNTDIASGYSEIGGGWQSVTTKQKSEYGKDARLHQGGGDAAATWTPNINTAGEYKVSVWIPNLGVGSTANLGVGSTAASYRAYYDGGMKEVRVNQNNGGNTNRWLDLGSYKFTPGLPSRLELSNAVSSGNVVADAAKFVYQGMYLSEDSPDAELRGNWQVKTDAGRGGSYRKIEAGSGGLCIWRPNIPATGRYRVSVSRCLFPAPYAVYTVTAQGKPPLSIRAEQSCGYLEVDLGVFEFQAGSGNTIVLEQSSEHPVYTDGIRVTGLRAIPDSSQTQQLVASMVNEIDLALGYLNNIQPDFQDYANLHTVDRNGAPVWTEFDYSDVLALKSMLNMLKVQFSQFAAYDSAAFDLWDLMESPVLRNQFSQIEPFLSLYPRLGGFTPEGASLMRNSKDAYINALQGYIDAYESVKAETDDQGNDLFTFDFKSLSAEDTQRLARGIAEMQKILANLRGDTMYYLANTYAFNPLEAQARGDIYLNLPINYRQYFDNPINSRLSRPRFDGNNQILRNSTPDPTFGGLLPGIGQPQLDGLFGLAAKLEQPRPVWADKKLFIALTWKKDVYPDFVRYKIFRSATENVNEASFKVYEGSNKNITTFTDPWVSSKAPVYYYRMYAYYRGGMKIAGPVRRVMPALYVSSQAKDGGDGSRQQPLRKISDALKFARPGVKICVAQGTYAESDITLNFNWGKSGIVLEGGYNPSTWQRDPATYPTVIDATGLKSWGSVIKLDWANDISIDGFNIKGAQDYGISVYGGERIKIKNCIVSGMVKEGIKIESYWGSTSARIGIENCRVINNRGYGVYVAGPICSIKNCQLIGNQSGAFLGFRYADASHNISDSLIADNKEYGITGATMQIVNNLIKDNVLAGINCGDNDKSVIANNTIIGSRRGIAWDNARLDDNPAVPQVKNNIIAFNQQGIFYQPRPDGNTSKRPQIAYNDLWNNPQGDYVGCAKGAFDISADPLFVSGRKGEYYLSQLSAGQQVDSLCVDAGSTTAAEAGLADYVTNSNYLRDTGRVDIGYHYSAPIARILANPAAVNGVISGRSTLGVQFYGDSSQGEIVSYVWNFGDGTTASMSNPGHTFITNSRSKTYIVTLTVVDKDGITASTTAKVDVKPRAMSWFSMGGD
jgi:hypothetical protein